MNTEKEYSPHELAELWRIRPAKVYAWIASGELQAEDMSLAPGITKPRWRITTKAAQAFRESRRTRRPSESAPRRRRHGGGRRG